MWFAVVNINFLYRFKMTILLSEEDCLRSTPKWMLSLVSLSNFLQACSGVCRVVLCVCVTVSIMNTHVLSPRPGRQD